MVRKPLSEEGQKWLAVVSPENWKKCLDNCIWAADNNRAQQLKKMRINDEIVVYLTGVGMKLAAICKVVSDYYYDETKVWDDGIYPHRVKIEPIKIPNEPVDIRKTYHVYLGYKGSSGGYFGQAIRPLPTEEFSIFQAELSKNMGELKKWDDLDENLVHDTSDDNERYVFVTGYNEENLQISKKSSILGWARNSNYLSEGSLVFVFDNTNLFLDSCFKIISKLDNMNEKLWADEIKLDKIIYPNRWKAELIQDNLKIPLSEINKIPPFDKEPFQGLLRGNFPMPLNSPQNKDKYEKFRNFIFDKLINYWIFIVSDQPSLKLSAEDIYQTRMNDMFWGLNENTPHRKHIKKGDQVVFCHGAKKFLGTAKLETDSFKLDEEQKTKFSHNIDFYKASFGVMLSDIDIWKIPKEVSQYVKDLSFISNIQQYPVYFQGGIKKIKLSDYNLIAGDKLIDHIDNIFKDTEFFNDESLSVPNKEQIESGYNKIREILLIPEEKVIEILTALASGRHVLLAGPIGTGKTRLASMIPEIFWNEIGGYKAEIYTATSDWNTQEVIGGIYPKMENGKVVYDIQYGCVVETVGKNWENGIYGGRRVGVKPQVKRLVNKNAEKKLPYRGIWLVIDEFNRADIDKAFGQLFTALRTRSLKIPTNEIDSSYRELIIPRDYRIIGTLNTADKHFLFQLSDALKSRFAYIEVDTPSRKNYNEEIYYALKNAIDEMGLKKENYEDFITLDVISKTISAGRLGPDFYNFIIQGYYFLDSVRVFKKLGTAILQIIYQNMLTSIRITGDAKSSLDNALTSTLLPQLENLSLITLGVLEIFYSEETNEQGESIEKYFKNGSKTPNRQSYAEPFEKVLRYLQIDDYKQISQKFEEGTLNTVSEGFWTNIENAFAEMKKILGSDLTQFRKCVIDLKKSAVI